MKYILFIAQAAVKESAHAARRLTHNKMKCKCGNEIEIRMGSKLVSRGCRILTAMTVVVTAQCEKCGAMFQVPVKSDGAIVKRD